MTPIPPGKPRRGFRPARTVIALATTAAITVGGTLGANAFFLKEGDFEHYVECVRYMLFNSELHRLICSPYIGPPPDTSSLSGTQAGPPSSPPVTTTAPTTTTVPTTTVVPTTTATPTTTRTVPTTTQEPEETTPPS